MKPSPLAAGGINSTKVSWSGKNYETDLSRKTSQKAAALLTQRYPAQAAELQEKIDDTVKDINAIIAHVPTEADFDQALRANADFLHVLDQLRNSTNRRRFADHVPLLDEHGPYLDRTIEKDDEVVDADSRGCDTDREITRY